MSLSAGVLESLSGSVEQEASSASVHPSPSSSSSVSSGVPSPSVSSRDEEMFSQNEEV